MQRTYYVRAIWDDEAKTYYNESDIRGLHIETPSLEEFAELVSELGPDMLATNHLSEQDLANKSLPELVPTIVMYRPEPAAA